MDSVLRKVQERLKTKIMRGSERGGAKYFRSSRRDEGSELQADLNSNSLTRQKMAVKRIIANMSLGREVSYLFVDVVKLGATHNLELKKLVYLYILSTAKLQPEKALLVVNTFLQDANHSSPVVRALALRTMLCVRVPFVTECTLEPLRKALQEDNPYVLKTAALALGKIFHLDKELFYDHNCLSELIKLLGQSHPMVVGNAAAVMCEVMEYGTQSLVQPSNVDVLHLLRVLPNASEWAQVYLLELIAQPTLIAYIASRNVSGDVTHVLSSSAPTETITTVVNVEANTKERFSDNRENQEEKELSSAYLPPPAPLLHRSNQGNTNISLAEVVIDMVIPRLNHSSPAIVLAAIKFIALLAYRCTPEQIERYTSRISTALSMFSKASPEVQYVLCKNVHALLVIFPNLLRSNLQVFFVRFNDPPYVKLEKMRLLLKLVTAETARVIADELAEYSNEVDPLFVNEVIDIVAAFALKVSSMAESCCSLLLSMVSRRPEFLSRVLIATMHIARKYPHLLIFDKLMEQAEIDVESMDEDAKVALIWTIGEYYEQLQHGQAILEHFTQSFAEHESAVQLALLCALVKVYITTQTPEMEAALQTVLTIITEQSTDPDLRDRAFAYWRLLSQGMSVQDMRQIVYSRLVPVNVDHTFSDAMSIADLKNSLNTSTAVFARLTQSFLRPYGYSIKRNSSSINNSDGDGTLSNRAMSAYYVRDDKTANGNDNYYNFSDDDDDDEEEEDANDEDGDDKNNSRAASSKEHHTSNTNSNIGNSGKYNNRSTHDDLFVANNITDIKNNVMNLFDVNDKATGVVDSTLTSVPNINVNTNNSTSLTNDNIFTGNSSGLTKKVKIQNLLDDLFEHINVNDTSVRPSSTCASETNNAAKDIDNIFTNSNNNSTNIITTTISSNSNNNNNTSAKANDKFSHHTHDPFASLVPAFKETALQSSSLVAEPDKEEISQTKIKSDHSTNTDNKNTTASITNTIPAATTTLDDLLKEARLGM